MFNWSPCSKQQGVVELQPDQINMAVFIWYLLKSDLQGTRKTRPCITGHLKDRLRQAEIKRD